MKAVFISYNQAYYDAVTLILEKYSCKGYTKWNDIAGNGSTNGEPHLGSHAWPTLNDAVLTIVEDNFVEPILASLKEMDTETPALGLRAFVWNVENIL